MVVMRGNNQGGLPLGPKALQQIHDLAAGMGVQISRRLVRQKHFRLIHQGAGDGHPLLFAAGKFRGLMLHPRSQPHAIQQVPRPYFRLIVRQARHAGRQADIFQSRQLGQKVVGLKDKADPAIAEMGEFVFAISGNILPAKNNLTGIGHVQAADQMQQGAFPGSGRTAQGHEIAAQNLQIHATQHFQRTLAHDITFPKTARG